MQLPTATLNAYLQTLATKAIIATEQAAMDYYLNSGNKLKDKGKLALDYGMAQYAKATANIPMLAATTLDDAIVRGMLQKAMQTAWNKLDDSVKQQAREVTESVTVTKFLPPVS